MPTDGNIVPVCGQYLGGCVCHGELPVSLRTGVCHTTRVVSECGCGFRNPWGVVSHSVEVVLCAQVC